MGDFIGIRRLQELLRCSNNFDEFCTKVGIDREGLRACLNDAGTRGLNVDYQQKLADSIGFKQDWPEWIERDPKRLPNGARRDTAVTFLDRCRRECFADTGLSTSSTERRIDLPLKSVRKDRPNFCDDQLATVELHASQSGPGEPWPVSIDLICNRSVIAGVEVAVKRGRLKLDCGASRLDFKSNVAYCSSYTIECPSHKVTLTLGGTSQLPSWEVQAENCPVGFILLPYDFCMIHDLAPGDIIGARFLVYIMDLEDIEGDETDVDEECAPEADSLSFLRVGYKRLGSAKQKILKRIAQMQLPGGERGMAILATDELQFDTVAKDVSEDQSK